MHPLQLGCHSVYEWWRQRYTQLKIWYASHLPFLSSIDTATTSIIVSSVKGGLLFYLVIACQKCIICHMRIATECRQSEFWHKLLPLMQASVTIKMGLQVPVAVVLLGRQRKVGQESRTQIRWGQLVNIYSACFIAGSWHDFSGEWYECN